MIYDLKDKILNNQAKICIIGLGYVGLPLAISFSKKFNVIGYDIDKSRIISLKHNMENLQYLRIKTCAFKKICTINCKKNKKKIFN